MSVITGLAAVPLAVDDPSRHSRPINRCGGQCLAYRTDKRLGILPNHPLSLCLAPRDRKLWLSWPAYREDLAHVRGEHSAIVRRKAGQRTPLVPGNRQRLSQGAASVRETDDSQSIAVALELGGNNRHTVSRLSKG
jgi:hypothetical protein